jgi:phage tail sheath protein FI
MSRARASSVWRARDPIAAAPASVAAFVGSVPGGPLEGPVLVSSLVDFEGAFGSVEGEAADAVRLFFENGGTRAYVVGTGEDPRWALAELRDVDFQLLAVPTTGRSADPRLALAAALLARERRAFYVADPPAGRTAANVERWARAFGGGANAALYFPRLLVRDPTGLREVAASGAVLGLYARVERERGVWQQPAGSQLALRGVAGLAAELTTTESSRLAGAGVNAVRRSATGGIYLTAARTRAERELKWKFVHVRRLSLFIEESLAEGTAWAVFEPNDETLWEEIRRDAADFLRGLFRAGALRGATPREAFFVRCDRTTMSEDDIARGRLVFLVGFAPLRPAEFIVLRIEQALACR